MPDQIPADVANGLGVFGLGGFGLASLGFGFSTLLGFLEAIAIRLDLDDFRPVGEPVDERRQQVACGDTSVHSLKALLVVISMGFRASWRRVTISKSRSA